MTFPINGSFYKFLSRPLSLYFGLYFAALAVGCGDRKKTTEQAVTVEETAETTREEVLKTLGGNTMTSGFVFQTEALADISKVPHYLQLNNPRAAAVNLGVYMSDLGYLTDFDQRVEAKRYFDGCLVLANHIGMGRQFSHAVGLRFSEIIKGNEDLKISLERLFQKTSTTASGDDFKKLHAAALTGYYVEELYHLIVLLQSDENSEEVRMKAIQTLIRQRSGVDNLVRYFDHLQLKPEGIVVYQEFLKLQASYLDLDATRLQDETDPGAILTDKNFEKIVSSLLHIRSVVTEM